MPRRDPEAKRTYDREWLRKRRDSCKELVDAAQRVEAAWIEANFPEAGTKLGNALADLRDALEVRA